MAMSAHSHQIAMLLLHPFDDLLIWFAKSRLVLSRNAELLKLESNSFQIGSVFDDFWTDGMGTIGPSSPSISYVKQHDAAMRELCKLLDVLDDRPVGRRTIQCQKNR